MEQETIEGFNIPLRELTEEEASRPITLERFDDFHVEAGEDFIDQVGSVNDERVALIFLGFAMAKHPEWSQDLLDAVNGEDSPYTQLVKEVYDDIVDDWTNDVFYRDFAEFLNLTTHAKKRVNQVLIQVHEKHGRL